MSDLRYSSIFSSEDTEKDKQVNVLLIGFVARLTDIFIELTNKGRNVTICASGEGGGLEPVYKKDFALRLPIDPTKTNAGNEISIGRKQYSQPRIDSVVYLAEKDIISSEQELLGVKQLITELWNNEELSSNFNLILVGHEFGITKYNFLFVPQENNISDSDKTAVPNYNILKIVYNEKSTVSGLHSAIVANTKNRDLAGNYKVVEDELINI